MTFVPRVFLPPKHHFFLLGPRGAGKTAWCEKEFPDALRVGLLDPAALREYSGGPERLIANVMANTNRKHIVIDKIQKLQELLNAVHLLIERKTGQQFIMTGSSACCRWFGDHHIRKRFSRPTAACTCAKKYKWKAWCATRVTLRAFLKP